MSATAAAKKKSVPVRKLTKRRTKPVGRPDPSGWPELLTVEQCAAYQQRHRLSIYREIADGTIPSWVYVRFGPRTIRIFKSQLEKYMAEKSAKGAR